MQTQVAGCPDNLRKDLIPPAAKATAHQPIWPDYWRIQSVHGPVGVGHIMMVNTDDVGLGAGLSHLAGALAEEGYQIGVVRGLSGALDSLREEHPSLVILCGSVGPHDWLVLRQVTTAPILALLPQPTEMEILTALDAGVDDCQMASIGVPEILSRVRALLRRGTPGHLKR
ncbi:MAG: hypothetical protein M1546_04880 [Chloroflexi bacterium]|nr:hypothetical protein [Chloroflexota bacterium]